MANVVQKRRSPNGGNVGFGDVVLEDKPFQHSGRQVHYSQRMREPGVFGPLVGEVGEPELPYSPEPLKLRGIYQADEQPALVGIRLQPDDIVDRVPVDPFFQCRISPDVESMTVLTSGACNFKSVAVKNLT